MAQVVDEAIETYRQSRFWAAYDAAYAALKADPVAWADYQREIHAWDTTLADGLEPEPNVSRKSKSRPRSASR
jgi:hypothetical protein